ncbi:hypothetical protein MBCUT_00820 [Methanobrevibacter cuticularis]|uniref:Uncharacterized protein n=1 Tax=Methanobrevibacter cuticularis TaxID=47311 RepID=A0A166CZT0_9EURY|nr:hypothetical protein [Methanobrevibacter cuticularis]KZX17787.1 hypothetical protein MBCUT_00820 [Methanobrevibacter cuticularis]
MPIEDKGKDENLSKKTPKSNAFPIAMILVILLIVGGATIAYFEPNLVTGISESLNNQSNQNFSVNKNNTTMQTDGPKQGYSEITIYGLKGYIKTEYMDFRRITDSIIRENNISSIEDYLTYLGNSSVSFVDYNDFIQLWAENGSFNLEVAPVNTSLELNNVTDNISNYNFDNVISDKTINVSGKEVRIVHYREYQEQNWIGEKIWAYFTVKEKNVAIGWEGNKADMYVIESFLQLNK